MSAINAKEVLRAELAQLRVQLQAAHQRAALVTQMLCTFMVKQGVDETTLEPEHLEAAMARCGMRLACGFVKGKEDGDGRAAEAAVIRLHVLTPEEREAQKKAIEAARGKGPVLRVVRGD